MRCRVLIVCGSDSDSDSGDLIFAYPQLLLVDFIKVMTRVRVRIRFRMVHF